jgi:phosphofructokinase-like protein
MADTCKVKRIGVLTGGGDCPGLNAVIRAVTKTALFQYKLEVWGIEDGYLGLIRNRMRRLNRDDVSNILTAGGTILGTSNKADPTHFLTDKDEAGNPVYKDVTPRCIEHFAERKLDLLICIGGDGTMSGAANLAGRGIPCVGVPKTIDNDLMGTETTFGFQTAVQIATEALDRIHTTASSHHRVMLVETMGRNAGWLALHSGVASGADIILLPEIPFDIDKVSGVCEDRSGHGKAFTIIAVSEGAKPVGGDVVVSQVVKDSPDPIRLGGVSQVVAEKIAAKTGLETRTTILGHVQRGGTPCAYDRVLATMFGHTALELAVQGQWNRMVAMQHGRILSVPVAEVAHRQRQVPMDHPLVLAARAVGTSLGV